MVVQKRVDLEKDAHVKDVVDSQNVEEEVFQTVVLQLAGILEVVYRTAVEEFVNRVVVAKAQRFLLNCQILAVVTLVVEAFVLRELVQ